MCNVNKTADRKEKAAYVTAIISFVAGWGMTIAGFIVAPVGEVSDSVLWVLGQGLIYAASVFGVALYVNHLSVKIKEDTRRYVRDLEAGKEAEEDAVEN